MNQEIQGEIITEEVEKLKIINHALRVQNDDLTHDHNNLLQQIEGVDEMMKRAHDVVKSKEPLDYAVEMYRVEADVLRRRLHEIMREYEVKVTKQREIIVAYRSKIVDQEAHIAGMKVAIEMADNRT